MLQHSPPALSLVCVCVAIGAQVLNGLHLQKRVAGVDAMLLRLYGPILFRALTAANAAVRRNSLLVMLDAFPLRVRGLNTRMACVIAL